jgi:hypothetical protein
MGTLLRAGGLSLLTLLCGVGLWWLLARAARERCKPTPPLGLCFAVGSAGVMLAGTLGLSVGMSLVFEIAFLAAGAVISLAVIARRGCRLNFPKTWPPDRLIGAALAVVAILGLLLMMPILGQPHISYDILSYHLPLAHEFRDTGWGYIDGNVYSRMPGGAFVLYGAVLSNAATTLDDPGVRVLLWSVVVACVALCWEIAGQLGGRWSARGLAAALLAWHPMVWGGVANAHNDLLVTLYALGAISCLLRGRAGRPSWILAAGLLCGSAVAVKFSALGIVAIPSAVCTALLVRGGWKQRAVAPLWLALGGAIAFGPWMLRAWWLGSHPLHPFMGASEGWSLEQGQFITGHHQPITPLAAEYWSDAIRRIAAFGYGWGPIVSIVAVGLIAGLAIWRWRRPVAVVSLVAWLGFGALLTVRISPDRFAMPAFALGSVVLAVVASIAWCRPIRRHGVFALVIVLVLFAAPWSWSLPLRDPAQYNRNATMPEAIILAAQEESDPGRTLLLFEARGRWFVGPSGQPPMMNTTWDVPPWTEGLRASESPEDFAQWLRGEGIRAVVVNEFELGRLADFYGEHGQERMMGNVGVEGSRERMLAALAHYKPLQFAGLSPAERERLLRILEWSRLRAKVVVPAGPVARIWVTPLGNLTPAQNGDADGDS